MSGAIAATGISAATFGAIGAAASVLGLVTGMGKKPQTPAVPALEKPPQASKAPDAAAIRKNNATALTGPAAGNASTFLTGASGIDDSTLNLGKNALLGQ